MPSPSPPPSPQPLPKNFHGYAAIKNYFVGLNIFFTVLNWHYHIHPILNGQQNKTTNKIELQHIIDLYHESNIATMHCTVPLAALHDGNFLWKNSWKKHLQIYVFTWLHWYFYVNSATFQSTVCLGSFLLHPYC